ncbi:TetR/AcrR family transcriptional regulator [Nocardia asteroides]|uniref:TetR/AcrR family transcriptional regulator n=1 Tax=Nocardia asteroides TaxID=1824 RepID=UPI001E426D72|nr:TetR/AcrR family transcriptional regulator [Nocardia asteroides]UGT63041.1 TetR/AcrR family transcriptional regulator [Nocardia asteroides]
MPAPTALELLWGVERRPTRGPKPALTPERIVAEAIALADADGLATLSMQRLAERLGFTKMSLYRYVPGKAELVALMLDAGIGAPPELPADDWRAALRRWCETLYERFRAHPWALEVSVGSRPVGPNEMAWMEAALTALPGTGLTTAERLDSIVLLTGHARSLGQQTVGVDPERFERDLAEQFTAMLPTVAERYPATVAAFAEEGAAAGGDGALAFGIDRILDGLAVLVDQRGH